MSDYAELRYGVLWALSETVGTSKNPNGSTHREVRVREWVRLPFGMITLEEWRGRVRKAIEENDDDGLFEAIKTHCREHCAWLRKEADVENHALECLVNGAYEAWEERGEFSYSKEEEKTPETGWQQLSLFDLC